MSLTGLDIYKLLPKTNCKDCGLPTCLAFAMKLAQKQIPIEKCPHLSEEAKQILLSAGEPPIRTVTLGNQQNQIKLGGETVLFRHEKRFYNPTCLGIAIKTSDENIEQKIETMKEIEFERVGQKIKVEMLCLISDSEPQKLVNAIQIGKEKVNPIFAILTEDLNAIEPASELLKDQRPLIGPITVENYQKSEKLLNYNAVPLVKGKDLEEITTINQKLTTMGFKDIVIDLSRDDPSSTLQDLVQVRRLALQRNFRPLGFPTFVSLQNTDAYSSLSWASMFIAKYASIITLPVAKKSFFLPLLVLRQNIYTDPQKPIVVKPKLYPIGNPNENSPVLVTSNFSLTYYIVEAEITNSKVPSWLLVVDSEGFSVLTAWAAEKFTPEKIFEAMKKEKLEEKLKHRKIIIPGLVAVMSGKLNEISNWEVLVGPREATGIPKYLKSIWK